MVPNLFARPKQQRMELDLPPSLGHPILRGSRAQLLRGGSQLGIDPACVTTPLFFAGDHGGIFFFPLAAFWLVRWWRLSRKRYRLSSFFTAAGRLVKVIFLFLVESRLALSRIVGAQHLDIWWIVYRKSWAGGAKYDVEEMKSILEVNLELLVEHFF